MRRIQFTTLREKRHNKRFYAVQESKHRLQNDI